MASPDTCHFDKITINVRKEQIKIFEYDRIKNNETNEVTMENENLDKKVLVTGASGGIGRAIAVEAAKAGYYVICHYNGSQGKADWRT